VKVKTYYASYCLILLPLLIPVLSKQENKELRIFVTNIITQKDI